MSEKPGVTGRQALVAVLVFACLMFAVTAYARSVILEAEPDDTEYLPPVFEEWKADGREDPVLDSETQASIGYIYSRGRSRFQCRQVHQLFQ